MNHTKTIQSSLIVATVLTVMSSFDSQLSIAHAQGTAFTYQGRLNSSNSPASGTYNFAFELFTVPLGGFPMGPEVLANGVAVTNGLFTVALDFGSSPWNGQTNWLLIQVETNGAASYTSLFPRQQLTPAPYAIYSELASNLTGTLPIGQVSGTVPVAQLPAAVVTNTEPGVTLGGTFNGALNGTHNGNGLALTNLNASNLAGGVVPTNVLPSFQAPNYVTIGGGKANWGSWAYDTVGGGYLNIANSGACTVAGGQQNTATNGYATVGGGNGNTAYYSGVVAGGYQNTAWPGAFVGGGGFDGINSIGNFAGGIAAAVVGGVNNKATNYYAVVGGGWGNVAGGPGSFVGGGGFDGTVYLGNLATGGASVVAGGSENEASAPYSTVGGGGNNESVYAYATVAGGYENFADGPGSFVGGGGFDGNVYFGNSATAGATVVAGGFANTAEELYATVGGGIYDGASGYAATVPGGSLNLAAGSYSFAAGQQAKANYEGDFVWADSQDAAFNSTANDQFLIRAQGGVGIGTAGPAAALNVASSGGIGFPQLQVNQQASDYARLRFVASGYPGWDIAVQPTMNFFAGGFGNVLVLETNGNAIVTGTVTAHGVLLTSDRNAKENFTALNPQTMLAKVAALPVTEWNYKTDDQTQKHIGPMAQDFQAAFQLSADDKHISVVDEGGVALAAIQGLNQKLEEQRAASKIKDAEIESLKQSVAELKQLVQSLTENK